MAQDGEGIGARVGTKAGAGSAVREGVWDRCNDDDDDGVDVLEIVVEDDVDVDVNIDVDATGEKSEGCICMPVEAIGSNMPCSIAVADVDEIVAAAAVADNDDGTSASGACARSEYPSSVAGCRVPTMTTGRRVLAPRRAVAATPPLLLPEEEEEEGSGEGGRMATSTTLPLRTFMLNSAVACSLRNA